MIELDDRRVLGALELVDATTGLRIRRPLAVEAEVEVAGARVVRNRSCRYVLLEVPGLGHPSRSLEARQLAVHPLHFQQRHRRRMLFPCTFSRGSWYALCSLRIPWSVARAQREFVGIPGHVKVVFVHVPRVSWDS